MSKGFHEAISGEPGRLFPLAGGVRQRSGRFSGWLGRSLAQVAVAGSRGRGQSPGDFERPTLVDTDADQVTVTIPNRPEAGPAVLGDGDRAHDSGMNPPLCSRIASS
jgi:hypothetical protein